MARRRISNRIDRLSERSGMLNANSDMSDEDTYVSWGRLSKNTRDSNSTSIYPNRESTKILNSDSDKDSISTMIRKDWYKDLESSDSSARLPSISAKNNMMLPSSDSNNEDDSLPVPVHTRIRRKMQAEKYMNETPNSSNVFDRIFEEDSSKEGNAIGSSTPIQTKKNSTRQLSRTSETNSINSPIITRKRLPKLLTYLNLQKSTDSLNIFDEIMNQDSDIISSSSKTEEYPHESITSSKSNKSQSESPKDSDADVYVDVESIEEEQPNLSINDVLEKHKNMSSISSKNKSAIAISPNANKETTEFSMKLRSSGRVSTVENDNLTISQSSSTRLSRNASIKRRSRIENNIVENNTEDDDFISGTQPSLKKQAIDKKKDSTDKEDSRIDSDISTVLNKKTNESSSSSITTVGNPQSSLKMNSSNQSNVLKGSTKSFIVSEEGHERKSVSSSTENHDEEINHSYHRDNISKLSNSSKASNKSMKLLTEFDTDKLVHKKRSALLSDENENENMNHSRPLVNTSESSNQNKTSNKTSTFSLKSSTEHTEDISYQNTSQNIVNISKHSERNVSKVNALVYQTKLPTSDETVEELVDLSFRKENTSKLLNRSKISNKSTKLSTVLNANELIHQKKSVSSSDERENEEINHSRHKPSTSKISNRKAFNKSTKLSTVIDGNKSVNKRKSISSFDESGNEITNHNRSRVNTSKLSTRSKASNKSTKMSTVFDGNKPVHRRKSISSSDESGNEITNHNRFRVNTSKLSTRSKASNKSTKRSTVFDGNKSNHQRKSISSSNESRNETTNHNPLGINISKLSTRSKASNRSTKSSIEFGGNKSDHQRKSISSSDENENETLSRRYARVNNSQLLTQSNTSDRPINLSSESVTKNRKNVSHLNRNTNNSDISKHSKKNVSLNNEQVYQEKSDIEKKNINLSYDKANISKSSDHNKTSSKSTRVTSKSSIENTKLLLADTNKNNAEAAKISQISESNDIIHENEVEFPTHKINTANTSNHTKSAKNTIQLSIKDHLRTPNISDEPPSKILRQDTNSTFNKLTSSVALNTSDSCSAVSESVENIQKYIEKSVLKSPTKNAILIPNSSARISTYTLMLESDEEEEDNITLQLSNKSSSMTKETISSSEKNQTSKKRVLRKQQSVNEIDKATINSNNLPKDTPRSKNSSIFVKEKSLIRSETLINKDTESLKKNTFAITNDSSQDNSDESFTPLLIMSDKNNPNGRVSVYEPQKNQSCISDSPPKNTNNLKQRTIRDFIVPLYSNEHNHSQFICTNADKKEFRKLLDNPESWDILRETFEKTKEAARKRAEMESERIRKRKEYEEEKRKILEKEKRATEKKRKQIEKEAKMSAFYKVNGRVWKPPRLPRPKPWCTDRLYKYLQEKLALKHSHRKRIESEKLMMKLARAVEFVEKAKTYKEYKEVLNWILRKLAKENIIKTRYDFDFFCYKYLPWSFRKKATPIMLPGNVQTIPFNGELWKNPILSDAE